MDHEGAPPEPANYTKLHYSLPYRAKAGAPQLIFALCSWLHGLNGPDMEGHGFCLCPVKVASVPASDPTRLSQKRQHRKNCLVAKNSQYALYRASKGRQYAPSSAVAVQDSGPSLPDSTLICIDQRCQDASLR